MVVPRVLDWEGLQAGPSTNHQQVQEALEASREEQVVPAVLQAGPSKDQLREALEAFRGGLEVHRPLEALVASREVLAVRQPLEALGALQAYLEVLEGFRAWAASAAYLEAPVVHQPSEA